jgi:hypothetical protein
MLALACGLLALGAPVLAGDDAATYFPIPGGVADAKAETGYLANPTGGFHAIQLVDGKEVSEQADAGTPLAMAGTTVFTAVVDAKNANTLRICAFAATTGKRIWRSEPLEFPKWVVVDSDARHWFGLYARVKDGDLWLRWRAADWKTAAEGRSRAEKDATHKAEGSARVKGKDGSVEMFDGDKMPPPPPPPVPVSKELEKLAARPIPKSLGKEKTVTEVGNFAVAVDVEGTDGRQTVVLKRWEIKTDKALPPVELVSGGAFDVAPAPAFGLVLIRPAVAPKQRAGNWQVFSMETGKEVFRLPVEADTIDGAIVGSRLYYTAPAPPAGTGRPEEGLIRIRLLKAVDLKKRSLAWWTKVDDRYSHFLYPGDPPIIPPSSDPPVIP